MKKTKVFLTIFIALLLIASIFLFLNRDKFVYVGSVDYVEVDCNKKSEILSEVYASDQKIRRENNLIKNAKEDHRNQELVISIIVLCMK